MTLETFFSFQHYVKKHLKILFYFVGELDHYMRLNFFIVVINRNILLFLIFIRKCDAGPDPQDGVDPEQLPGKGRATTHR